MSITRLQQARQMYAMGQRVSRAFGGVMGDDGRRQYGGGSDMGQVSTYNSSTGTGFKAGPGTGGYQGGTQGGMGDADRDGPTDQNPYDKGKEEFKKIAEQQKEDYLTGVGQSQLQHLYDTGVSKINAPFNLPSPFTTVLNIAKPIRDFGLRKNIDYFKGLSQTKYPQTLQGYKDYMKDRLGGKITASGNTHPNYYTDSQGNYILRDGGGGGEGIMDVVVDETADDTTTTDDFFSRYLQNQPEDVRKEIEARMQNYYTV